MGQVAAAYKGFIDWQDKGVANVQAPVARGLGLTKTDVLADVSAALKTPPGLTMKRGTDRVRPLPTLMAGTSAGELINTSQLYSAENSASALFAYLEAGHQMQFQAVYNSVRHDLWTGYLNGLPQYADKLRKSVGIPGVGMLAAAQRLPFTSDPSSQTGISTALYQNITTDIAIGHLLDALGFPSGLRSFQTGNTLLAWWWLNNEDPFTALQTLVNSEGPGARLYEDGSGLIVFENRQYRYTTARCTTSQATFSDGTAGHTTEPLHSLPFSYDKPEQDIVNACTVVSTTRSAKTQAQVWTLGSSVGSPPSVPYTLAPNQTQTFYASTSDPYTQAQIPGSVQTLSVAGSPSGGTITLSFGGQTTGSISIGDSASSIQTKLQALSSIGSGNMTCTGGPFGTSPVLCTFAGTLANTYQLPMTHADSLTGGSAPAATITTDLTVSAGSIASVTFAINGAAVTGNSSAASGANLGIVVTAGSAGAVISALSLQAQQVSVDSSTVLSSTIDASASIKTHGTRNYQQTVRNEIALNTLQDFCNAVVSWYKDPRPVVGLTLIASGADARMTQALTRMISDRVTVQESQTLLNADCFIESVAHKVTSAGLLHTTSYVLEKANATGYFTLDTSDLDDAAWVLGF